MEYFPKSTGLHNARRVPRLSENLGEQRDENMFKKEDDEILHDHKERVASRNRGNGMKLLLGTMVLALAPLLVAGAGNDAVYPTEKVAAFVFEKVDVTSLPSAIRPKPLKGKKTFSDYGYVARELGEKNATLEPPQGASKISIEVLEAQKSGIYVCVNSRTTGKTTGQFQRVFLLKLKNGDGLLKGREAWKEFDACPVIGGGDQGSSSY